jgi:hypothetical protein
MPNFTHIYSNLFVRTLTKVHYEKQTNCESVVKWGGGRQ